MKNSNVATGLIFIGLLIIGTIANAQSSLWFGTVKMQNTTSQGRFEVFSDSVITSIVYAPYGISPTTFKDVKQQNNQLTFEWQINHSAFHCLLLKQDSATYLGNCTSESKAQNKLHL